MLKSVKALFFCLSLACTPAMAQEADVTPVSAKETAVENPLDGLYALTGSAVVLELFTTQACTFCPKADAFMQELANHKNLIALSCHVDYFDVKAGSLSLPACSERQAAYEATLRQGPKYTPQIVINGRKSVVGYRRADVWNTISEAAKTPVMLGQITELEAGKVFEIALPQMKETSLKIWVLAFEKPKTLTVADGANRGKEFTYYNVVSEAKMVEEWNGKAKNLRLDPTLDKNAAGFVVLVQDTSSQNHVLVAQYLLSL